MAEIIDLSAYRQERDPDHEDRAGVQALLKAVRDKLALLDQEEPEDMEGEEYQRWGDHHEALEDMADELQDRLDELGGA